MVELKQFFEFDSEALLKSRWFTFDVPLKRLDFWVRLNNYNELGSLVLI